MTFLQAHAPRLNAEAIYHPYQPSEHADDTDGLPCIEIAGVQVYAYVDRATGELAVSLHLDGDTEVWGDNVPVRIGIGDYLYRAGVDGAAHYPALEEAAQQLQEVIDELDRLTLTEIGGREVADRFRPLMARAEALTAAVGVSSSAPRAAR